MKNNYKIDKGSGLRIGYLKCDYSEGIFNQEYQIRFKARNQNWCFVNRTDVIASDKEQGYVRVLIQNKIKEGLIVLINDTGDRRLSPFSVIEKDVVARIV